MYDAFPLDASPERAEIISDLMRRVAATESVFSEALCDAGCIQKATLPEMCAPCLARMRRVAAILTHPETRAWEVWALGAETRPVGVVMLTEIVAGWDAKAHYIFFDERLADKTEVLRDLIRWVFDDHPEEGWVALQRLTIEIPEPFVALARHASKRLGFGGGFKHRIGEAERPIWVEGVRRQAALWKGSKVDVLVAGLLRSEESRTTTEAAPSPQESR